MAKLINYQKIPLLIRIWFLYFEPLAALGGTYLCIFLPHQFIVGTVPHPYLTAIKFTEETKISPILQMMLTNIGSLYILFAVQEGIVLRLTREKAVWIAVMVGMILSDVGHLYAAYSIAPERMTQFSQWKGEEWVNVGTLMGGLALRVFFLMGIGNY